MTYWGQPRDRDSEGRIARRWKVRRNPKGRITPVWDVFEPDGTWTGIFESWAEAMDWATSAGTRIEYWLHQGAL